MEDDGSLSFLNIPIEENNKQFHGKVMTQQQLTNMEFYVLDFTMIEKTKYGANRMLIRIKKDLNDKEEFKFFTNSHEIEYTLKKIFELKKFPRKMTLRGCGNRYWVE